MGFFSKLFGFVAEEAVDVIKGKVEETLIDIETKVERATKKAIKVLVLYVMVFLGAIFMLVGLAKYLNETVPSLAHALGFVLVGACLVVLALFASMMRS